MKPINVEITMGHNIGISSSYYKPTEKEVLEDYLKAVDLLTINRNEQKLAKQVEELKEKSKDSEYIIKGKLEEKDRQLEQFKTKYDEDIELLKDAVTDMQKLLKNPQKLADLIASPIS